MHVKRKKQKFLDVLFYDHITMILSYYCEKEVFVYLNPPLRMFIKSTNISICIESRLLQ